MERLAPVAFDKYIVVAAMFPTMIHPSRVRPRRRYPYARRPYVRVSIPAMVAPLINIARVRSDTTFLNHSARRRHFHDDLLAHRTDGQQAARDQSQKSFSHFLPFTDRASRRNNCFAKCSDRFRHLLLQRGADRAHQHLRLHRFTQRGIDA